MKPLILKEDILEALKRLDVQRGQNIMVHASLSSIGYVCGGAQSVIEALLECSCTVRKQATENKR